VQVVFTHDSALIETAMPTFGYPALLVQMSEAMCWAVAVVAGSFSHATTVQGQRLIDSALAWLIVVHSLGPDADTERSVRAHPELPTSLWQEPLVEGLLARRRSVESESKFTACAALSEAVECVLSSVKTEKLFDKDALKKVRASAPEGLSEKQLGRPTHIWDKLNEPSFMSKLMGFLENTGIVAEPDDLAASRPHPGSLEMMEADRVPGVHEV